jgi:hypothetical protein
MVVTLFVIGTRIPMTFLHFQGPPTTTFMLTAMTFDPTVALNDLLADVDLSTADAGGRVTFTGQDPTIAARHRLAAAIGIPMMGNAVAAAAPIRICTWIYARRYTTSIPASPGSPRWPGSSPRSRW